MPCGDSGVERKLQAREAIGLRAEIAQKHAGDQELRRPGLGCFFPTEIGERGGGIYFVLRECLTDAMGRVNAQVVKRDVQLTAG